MDRSLDEAGLSGENTLDIYNWVSGRRNAGGLFL